MAMACSTDTGRVDEILEAARRCFERFGVTRTRMGDIAAEVGIPRPHLYRYFDSKDALVTEVVLREVRLVSERSARRLRLRGSARHVITETLLRTIEEATNDDYVKLLLRSDIMRDTARIVAQTESVLDAIAQFWEPVLAYAARRGELREGLDLDATIRWLSFLLVSHVALPELSGSPVETRSQIEAFVIPALLQAA